MPTYRLPQVTDREWRVIAAVIPRPTDGPAPRHDREIISAVVYAQAADCSYESLPPGYPLAMSIRTRVQRWQQAGVLPDILEAAAPAIARVHARYWDHLRYLSFGPGWKLDRAPDDPALRNLPRQPHMEPRGRYADRRR